MLYYTVNGATRVGAASVSKKGAAVHQQQQQNINKKL